MNIGFWIDGNKDIGFGHFSRCYNLMKYLYDSGNDISLISNSHEEFKKINKINLNIKQLYTTSDVLLDVIIIDKYDVTDEMISDIKYKARLIGAIDDNGVHDNLDFIINGNIHADIEMYSKNPNTKYLLGLEFTMLDDRLFDYQKKVCKCKIESILVTMGGSDINDYTINVLKVLKQIEYSGKIQVVVGPGFKDENCHMVEKFAFNNDKLQIELFNNPSNLHQLMSNSDLIITASGFTVYELIGLRTPFVSIVQANNQSKIGERLVKLGIIERNICFSDADAELDLMYSIEKLLSDDAIIKDIFEKLSNIDMQSGLQRIMRELEKLWRDK